MDTVEAIRAFVRDPPADCVREGGRYGDEWTEEGQRRLDALITAHERAHPEAPYILAYKTHAYELEPGFDWETLRASADPRCEGGCCDDWRWTPGDEAS